MMRSILTLVALGFAGHFTAWAQEGYLSLEHPEAKVNLCTATDHAANLSYLLPNAGSTQDCGASWAMAPAYALDAAYKRKGQDVQVSVQQIVSCDVTDGGCQGGDPLTAAQYMLQRPLAADKAYPYTSGGGDTGVCRTQSHYPYQLGEYHLLPGADNTTTGRTLPSVATMKQALCAHGPLVSAANAENFSHYPGGVVSGDCPGDYRNLSATVLIVGWDDTKEAWLVDPFFGSQFGLNGYMWISYGTPKQHTCGIGFEAMWLAPK